jgi:hypothetical protein
MRKRGSRFSGALKFAQIAETYLPIPLQTSRIDHVHDFGSIQSKIIVIECTRRSMGFPAKPCAGRMERPN